MSSNGIKNYTESNTLLQYQGKIELGPDDPSYLSQKRNENSTIDNNPSLSETLNAMFLPREWEENGKKFIQYVSPEPATREKARDLFKALDAKLKEDLGADSIDAVQIIMDLEDAFGIEIDEDNAGSMETVGDVVKYIESKK